MFTIPDNHCSRWAGILNLPTDDLIHTMVEQIDTSALLGLRDRVILLLGFSGAFCRSELVRIRVENLQVHERGMDIYIRSSKTDQTGEGFKKPIRGQCLCPVNAVNEVVRTYGQA